MGRQLHRTCLRIEKGWQRINAPTTLPTIVVSAARAGSASRQKRAKVLKEFIFRKQRLSPTSIGLQQSSLHHELIQHTFNRSRRSRLSGSGWWPWTWLFSYSVATPETMRVGAGINNSPTSIKTTSICIFPYRFICLK